MKYYVVWKGRTPGLYTSWAECEAQVKSFPGAEYKSFDSRAAAEEALRGNYADYKGQRTTTLSPARLIAIGQPIVPSYAVDAACEANPGPLEYRCVETATRREIFHQGPFEHGTNNVGEFLAIVHALALFQKKDITAPIYSDSRNALKWVREKQCKTRLKRDEWNAELFELIERAEAWLQRNDYATRILKWETKAWGENPADFGRK